MLDGTWELAYTNSPNILALLAVADLPLSPLKVGALTQAIDAASHTVVNKVQLLLPGMSTALSTVATYEVASPKRLQYTISKGVIQTPELLQSLELPATINVMGQTVDITPLNQLLAPLLKNAEGLASSVTDVLAQTQSPSLELPNKVSSWQLNTYVDDSLRITRGDGGAVFVFQKK